MYIWHKTYFGGLELFLGVTRNGAATNNELGLEDLSVCDAENYEHMKTNALL